MSLNGTEELASDSVPPVINVPPSGCFHAFSMLQFSNYYSSLSLEEIREQVGERVRVRYVCLAQHLRLVMGQGGTAINQPHIRNSYLGPVVLAIALIVNHKKDISR